MPERPTCVPPSSATQRWDPAGVLIPFRIQPGVSLTLNPGLMSCTPSGVPGTPLPEPGGFPDISRWLRSNATTPPVHVVIPTRIPEGCQSVSGKLRGIVLRTPCLSSMLPSPLRCVTHATVISETVAPPSFKPSLLAILTHAACEI